MLNRSESAYTSQNGVQTSEFRNKLYQSPKGILNDRDHGGNFVTFLNRGEEDFLNPQDHKTKYLEMDNSLLMNNDPLRNTNSSFHLTNTTNRSLTRLNNDDTISCTSEVSCHDSSFKVHPGKHDYGYDMGKERMKHPDAHFDDKYKADWYHSQGFEARKRGDFHLAIEYYTKSLEIFPTHFKV